MNLRRQWALIFFFCVWLLVTLSSVTLAQSNNISLPLDRTTLETLNADEILESPNIFKDLYHAHQSKEISVKETSIKLHLFNIREQSFESFPNIPQSIIQIQNGEKSIFIATEASTPETDISYLYSLPNVDEPWLCINIASGGNWGATNSCHIIAVGPDSYIEELGVVYGAEDLDGDGNDEFYNIYTGMEHGLDYLDHASSPIIRVPIDIHNNKKTFEHYYRAELDRVNTAIRAFPTRTPNTWNADLLSLILEKLLLNHFLKQPELAWKQFDQDIRHYNAEYFLLHDSDTLRRIPVSELTKRAKNAILDWPITQFDI